MSFYELTPEISGAGGVVWRIYDNRVQIVLVHHQLHNDWSIPKGKIDAGEEIEACAIREVAEETGLNCQTEIYLGAFHYIDRYSRTKVVKYWSMHAGDDEELHILSPTLEIDEAKWVDVDDAIEIVSIARDRLVIATFVGIYNSNKLKDIANIELDAMLAAPKSPSILLRHASAGDRGKFKSSDLDRPLDLKGQQQAIKLATTLRQFWIRELWSSPAQRCLETLEPLSKTLKLPIVIKDSLLEGNSFSDKELFAKYLLPGVLICTHGDVLQFVLKSVANECSLAIPGFGESKKASLWLFNGGSSTASANGAGNFKVAGYVPPPQL